MRDLLLVLPHAAVETLKISAPTVIDAARGRVDRARSDQRLRRWAQRLADHVGMRVEVRGREHARAGASYVVMSNHQSHYDIPVIYLALPTLSIRMVAKAQLFRVPIWGQALAASGFVGVDRRDRARAIEALRAARETIASGISIWIAPEGTRSRTGALGELKQGGFHLAIETGTPILPVTIDGTLAVLPRGGTSVRRDVEVRVTIHPPIDTGAYGSERRHELVERVRDVLASGLGHGSEARGHG